MPTPIPQNLEPLYRALAECGIDTKKIPQTAERLTYPPISLHLSAWDPPGTALAIRSVVGFDRDLAARMLRLNEGTPDPEATWANLTRSEQKRAKRLWESALSPDKLRITPQGRPLVIDTALVLYLTRVICETGGQTQFKFRRPMGGGAPGGPMWRALVESLRIVGVVSLPSNEFKDHHAETIAEIATVTRSKKFVEWCHKFGLGPGSKSVAENPAMFRCVISLVRRSRPRKRPAPKQRA